jgi:hypothetical protein
MEIHLDHLMWAAPSLEVGVEEARRLFGVEPALGGAHPGGGTCNALLSLGGSTYLEIIAPDPDQDLSGTLGQRFAELSAPSLITWAAASPNLALLAEQVVSQALTARGPVPTHRSTPEGGSLSWELLFVGGHNFSSLFPFFIDWLSTPHPASTNPHAGEFQSLEISTPKASELNEKFQALGIEAQVTAAAQPGMVARIATKSGTVVLESLPETRGWGF